MSNQNKNQDDQDDHSLDHKHGQHHDQHHGHGHGHKNDQGIKGMLRYLQHAPRMWSSELNRAIVDQVAPVPGERVIDIGSGMGAGVVYAAKTGADVIAVEPTPFMRRILTVRRLLQRARGNIMVTDGSAEHLPAADRSVDVVIAVNTMHHWLDVGRGVAEIGRVLAPGGRVLMVDEDFENPDHPDHDRFGSDHHSAADEDEHDHHGFTLVDAAKMGELLTAAGLVDVDAGDLVIAGRPVVSVGGRRAR